MSDMEQYKQTFFTECAELLSDMEERLLKLDEGSQDKEMLNAIFRCAHSIKGGSGAFGYDGIMQFTHVTEALLDSFREGRLLPTRESIDLLLKSVDITSGMLKTAQEGGKPSADGAADVMAAMKSMVSGGDAAPPSSSAPTQKKTTAKKIYDITFRPQPGIFATGNEPLLILSALKKLGKVEIFAATENLPALAALDPEKCHLHWSVFLTTEAEEAEVRDVFDFAEPYADIKIESLPMGGEESSGPGLTAEKPEAPPATPSTLPNAAPKEAASPASTSIRVDLDKIDRLVNMVGELVITEAMLRAQIHGLPMDKFTDLLKGIDGLSHHTRELQEAVMVVRMQPVKSVFSRMPRIVRDTSAQLGKNIQLVMSGENTEVDKTVIEQLSDPLTHMIRNSIDHGIESPEKRLEKGKPAQGTIHLSAYHRSGSIIIEIRDDGAGINRDRVLSKAREKGLVAADAALTDEEIDHLIFLPGFSTADKVTAVSGRGVGMDVVRRNIEGLGGGVRITNMPGQGSVFTVTLPLTLAILDGMIVRIGRENYIVPITHIIETIRVPAAEIRHVTGHGEVMNVRGEFVPVVPLHKIFGISGAELNAPQALAVLVESGSAKMGLIVDELLGQQQVVIKSLQENADPVKGISGATILGDGKVALILEINELKNLCGRPQRRPVPATKHERMEACPAA